MAGLGGSVVVSGVADLPCGILQQALTGNPSQGPSSAPSGQGIANLVEGKAFDGVRGAIVVLKKQADDKAQAALVQTSLVQVRSLKLVPVASKSVLTSFLQQEFHMVGHGMEAGIRYTPTIV